MSDYTGRYMLNDIVHMLGGEQILNIIGLEKLALLNQGMISLNFQLFINGFKR
ncbi:MAG: hypothetical protein HRU34_10605 [Richelia sp.]|nr:hypothetical protein [Richelia sp.]